MTSAERIKAALIKQNVDYVPCVASFWPEFSWNKGKWEPDDEVLKVLKNDLGLDPYMNFKAEFDALPGISSKVILKSAPGEAFPLIHKDVETPHGKLSATVRKSADWPHGDDIPVHGSDWAAGRYIKPWIETLDDVKAIASFYQPPSEAKKERDRTIYSQRKAIADRWQIPVIGHAGCALDHAMWLMGAERAVFVSMDNPAVIDRLLETIYVGQQERLKFQLSLGITIFSRRGWYDTTDFWSPEHYKRWVIPQFKRDIEFIHSQGGICVYQCCTGMTPLLPLLQSLDFDCLMGAEPALGGQDMRLFARTLGDRKSFWGGVSDPVHLRTTPEAARAAVREAFQVFGKRGFLLDAVPSIKPERPWKNVLAFIDEWKKCR